MAFVTWGALFPSLRHFQKSYPLINTISEMPFLSPIMRKHLLKGYTFSLIDFWRQETLSFLSYNGHRYFMGEAVSGPWLHNRGSMIGDAYLQAGLRNTLPGIRLAPYGPSLRQPYFRNALTLLTPKQRPGRDKPRTSPGQAKDWKEERQPKGRRTEQRGRWWKISSPPLFRRRVFFIPDTWEGPTLAGEETRFHRLSWVAE